MGVGITPLLPGLGMTGLTSIHRKIASLGGKWGWIANVDAVSETCRCSWDDVWRMTALEFLNILSYRKDKLEKQRRDIEDWKKRN